MGMEEEEGKSVEESTYVLCAALAPQLVFLLSLKQSKILIEKKI